MFNPIVVWCADGSVFFMGLAAVTLSVLSVARWTGRIARIGLTVSLMVGLAITGASSTPIPYWLMASWATLSAGVGVVLVMRDTVPSERNARRIMAAAVTFASVGLCLVELPYHITYAIRVQPGEKICVIGDSISAGLGRERQLWPSVLGELSGIPVTNLARAGATLHSALKQADRVTTSTTMLLLEIGGNDILHGLTPGVFEKDLDTLLTACEAKVNHMVMFELPLLPFGSRYGAAQRSMAKKHRVVLISKHYLADVIRVEGATVDGLHLSQAGHDKLGSSVAALFKP